MSQIWARVAQLELGDQAQAWLRSRGISPQVAWRLGCRDWRGARAALLEYVEGLSPKQLIAAGLGRDDGRGKLTRWAGLRALNSESWARGLALPVVHPELGLVGWRQRLYQPTAKGLKALAQYSVGQMPSVPLGLGELTARLSQGEAPVVVVCEGEPDWLSMAQVAAQANLPVAALGGGDDVERVPL